jgi:ribosomal protein S18 acetylase RimI-like enzyme
MPDWPIVLLADEHKRSDFSCGKPPLDEFLRTLVSQYEKRHLGRTFVASHPGTSRVASYYTLAAGLIAFQNLPPEAARKLPRHPVPSVILVRLAVDRAAQGQGLGETLLLDALRRTLYLSETLGIHAVEVDAIDDLAWSFYEKYGFVPLPDNRLHLYLPIATIRKSLGRRGT